MTVIDISQVPRVTGRFQETGNYVLLHDITGRLEIVHCDAGDLVVQAAGADESLYGPVALALPQVTPPMPKPTWYLLERLDNKPVPERAWGVKTMNGAYNVFQPNIKGTVTWLRSDCRVVEEVESETPEQQFRRCLAEIGPMDAKAANEHIAKFDSGDWKDEWHFEVNAALEGKAR